MESKKGSVEKLAEFLGVSPVWLAGQLAAQGVTPDEQGNVPTDKIAAFLTKKNGAEKVFADKPPVYYSPIKAPQAPAGMLPVPRPPEPEDGEDNPPHLKRAKTWVRKVPYRPRHVLKQEDVRLLRDLATETLKKDGVIFLSKFGSQKQFWRCEFKGKSFTIMSVVASRQNMPHGQSFRFKAGTQFDYVLVSVGTDRLYAVTRESIIGNRNPAKMNNGYVPDKPESYYNPQIFLR